jgi:hypothetical protein
VRHALLALLLSALCAAASADELASASFRHRAGTFTGGGAALLESTAVPAAFAGSGVSIGQGEALGLAGSPFDLRAIAPGYWPIVAGAFPELDLDDDGIANFLDEDADGDGLLGEHETDTGVFVSASDTGSDPLDPDSDGDGFGDGVEVAQGTNPNDPGSHPTGVQVPALAGVWRVLATAGLWLAGLALGRRAARPVSRAGE